jgi:hypothetical protein
MMVPHKQINVLSKISMRASPSHSDIFRFPQAKVAFRFPQAKVAEGSDIKEILVVGVSMTHVVYCNYSIFSFIF